MTNKTIIFIALLCLALFVGGAYVAWMVLMPQKDSLLESTSPTAPAFAESPVPRPSGSSAQPVAPGQVSSENTSLSVSGFSGTTLVVRNFLSDPDVVKLQTGGDAAIYSLGSLPQDQTLLGFTTVTLPSASERGYELLFSESEGTFLVYLVKEPLGTMRRQVAADLQARLGVNQTELCTIQVAVVVTAPHPTLRGKYIGLPDCTDSLRLPE